MNCFEFYFALKLIYLETKLIFLVSLQPKIEFEWLFKQKLSLSDSSINIWVWVNYSVNCLQKILFEWLWVIEIHSISIFGWKITQTRFFVDKSLKLKCFLMNHSNSIFGSKVTQTRFRFKSHSNSILDWKVSQIEFLLPSNSNSIFYQPNI